MLRHLRPYRSRVEFYIGREAAITRLTKQLSRSQKFKDRIVSFSSAYQRSSTDSSIVPVLLRYGCSSFGSESSPGQSFENANSSPLAYPTRSQLLPMTNA